MQALALAPPIPASTLASPITARSPNPYFPIPIPATARELIDAQRKIEWRTDPERFLQNSYNQFCSVIMMVTFTGGIQIAALSFMNDVSASQPLTLVEPKLEHGVDAWYYQYSIQSFGFMLGFSSVFLCGVCGAVAAVNAALISYYFVYPPELLPALQGHLLFCMLLLFGTFVLSGVSLTLLSTNYGYPFTITTVFLFLFALVVIGYQVERQAKILRRLAKVAERKPFHASSAVVFPLPLVLSLLYPMALSWLTVALCLLTAAHYTMDCLYDKADKTTALYVPRGHEALFATALAFTWGGCAYLYTKRIVLYPGLANTVGYGLAGAASLESVLMGIIAVMNWHGTWKQRGCKETNKTPT